MPQIPQNKTKQLNPKIMQFVLNKIEGRIQISNITQNKHNYK